MKKLIVGNWKMHSLPGEAGALVSAVSVAALATEEMAEVVICPPATLLVNVHAWLERSAIRLGAQDCHYEQRGAYTGDISAQMLKEAGCHYVILGHSERRQHHKETSELVRKKAAAAHQAGLITIICVGEKAEEKNAGKTEAVIGEQLRASLPDSATAENAVIAYEPVWAIGSGETPEIKDITRIHRFILSSLSANTSAARVLYGGSVKADNAADILNSEGVGGVLVGGASLKAEEFCAIIKAV